MTFLRLSLLFLLIVFVSGCGDNGIIPTFMGTDDYSYTSPQDWTDLTSGTVSLFLATTMAEDYIVEHTFMRANPERTPESSSTMQILVDRSGPYTPGQMEIQYQNYLSRPVVNKPDSVRPYFDASKMMFRIEESKGAYLVICNRQYTKKGYVSTLARCLADDEEALQTINLFIDNLLINPDIAYH